MRSLRVLGLGCLCSRWLGTHVLYGHVTLQPARASQVDQLQGYVVRVGSFVEQARAALERIYLFASYAQDHSYV
jgi:hypothetical protein